MTTQTVEYELAKLLRDEKDIVVGREVLLPKEGEPFPRMQVVPGESAREEALRLNHKLVGDLSSRNVQVNFRPFVQS